MPEEICREKRPAAMIGATFKMMRIATGEKEDTPPDDGKDLAAVSMGKPAETARAAAMTSERRAEIARKAIKKWNR